MNKNKNSKKALEAKYHLGEINVVEIAFAGTPAVPRATFAVMKSSDLQDGREPVIKTMLFKKDPVKKQVFGYFLIPDEADHQGDVITKGDIEKACHSLMKNMAQHTQKGQATSDNHTLFSPNIGYPIESCIDTDGAIAKSHGVDPAPGAWWGGLQCTDETWAKVEKEEYTGFSIGGTGVRSPIESGADGMTKADSQSRLAKVLSSVIDVLKGDARTFDEVKEDREAWEALWGSFQAVESSIASILCDDTVENKAAMVAASIDQFKAAIVAFFAIQKSLNEISSDNIDALNDLAKASVTLKPILERIKETQKANLYTVGGTDMTTEELKALTEKIDGMVSKVDNVVKRVDAVEDARKSDDDKKADDAKKASGEKADSEATLTKSIENLTEKIDTISKRVETLEKTPGTPNGSPDSNTPIDGKPVKKSADDLKVEAGRTIIFGAPGNGQ